MKVKYSNWQSDGILIIIIFLILTAVCALMREIYFELFFATLFIVASITLRLNIELEKKR